MPGLTFYIQFDYKNIEKITQILTKVKRVYKIPSIEYLETQIIGDSFCVYSCLPDFIKDKKLIQIHDTVIGLDGDFYNEHELTKQLNKGNLTKLEIIYYLSKKEGINFAKLLNGEFNIIVYNTSSQELLVTNDRFARRPFFYKKLNGGIIFSSEKKGIISIMGTSCDLDPQGILELFVFRHNLRNRTFLKNIFHLQIASVVKVSRNIFHISKYFTWDFSNKSLNFNRITRLKEIAEAISKALEIRIYNKSRIILWLSGGYDSRTLACFINKRFRQNVLTETFGEENSDELEIANKVADRLGYRWRPQKVNLTYSQLAKISSWRTEFAVPAVDHPFIGNQISMKKEADYIIQGVPGIFEINSGHLSLGKVLASLGTNPYSNFFNRYAKPKEEISFLFNEDYINEYYNIIYKDFIEFFKNIETTHTLYKWDVFNLSQRQPNYSHMADLIEGDLFEMLHPMTDINLTPLFTQIPFKDKLFIQITRDLLFIYFPELRDIPIGNGRGYITKKNTLIRTAFRDVKSHLYQSSKSTVWNKKLALESDYLEIKKNIYDLLLSKDSLRDYFNFDTIQKLMNDKTLLIQNQMIIDILMSFIFTHDSFITNNELKPISEIVEHYK